MTSIGWKAWCGTILILVSWLFFACNPAGDPRQRPMIHQGQLDLSSWDLAEHGPIALNGEWAFYWNRLLTPTDFRDGRNDLVAGYLTVPKVWTDFEYQGKPVGGTGYGTYRLHIQLNRGDQRLGLKLLSISTAFRLWVNGQEVAGAGQVGRDETRSHPLYLPQTVYFDVDRPALDIVMQVSNFHHRRGGIWDIVELGTESQIQRLRLQGIGIALFLGGALLIMALYHFGLFALRPVERSTLYFGLACLWLSLNVVITKETAAMLFIPWEHFDLWLKLEYVSDCLYTSFFVLFFAWLFPAEFHRWVRQGALIYFTLVTAAILVLPNRLLTYTTLTNHPIFACLSLYGLIVLIRASWHGREGARWFLAGFLIFFITAVNDILHANNLIATGYFGAWGVFLLVLSQSFVLSLRFSKAFATIAEMSRLLETRVQDRTRDLDDKNIQLRQLVHILCHDLRNPLAGIQTALDLTVEDPAILPEVQPLMQTAIANGLAVIDIVRKLRALEEKKLNLELELHPLKPLIDESLLLLSNRIAAKNLQIHLAVEEQLEVMVEKTTFVNSVLNNILTNAIKFSHPHAAITVSAHRENDRIALSIKDTGIGIPAELLQNLLNMNKSSSREGTAGEIGTGFGIPLVNRLIQAYGGSMRVTSQTESPSDPSRHGTEVVLYLKSAA